MEVTIFVHKTLEECIAAGDHLETVDSDGYCNACGEQDDRPEQGDNGPEPAPVDFYLSDREPLFGLRSVLDSDQERAVEIRSWRKTPDGGAVEPDIHRLVLDGEDVVNMFLFSYTWLRASGKELPLLKLWTDGPTSSNGPQSIDIQAPGAPTIGVQFDNERNLYQILKLVGDGTWNEVTSVSASPASTQQPLTCPVCQGGPIFPYGDVPDKFECSHCETPFVLPGYDQEHGMDRGAKREPQTDIGESPGEVLAFHSPSEVEAIYGSREDEELPHISRQVIALGKPKGVHDYRACVLNKQGRLVFASTLPDFLGIHPEDE